VDDREDMNTGGAAIYEEWSLSSTVRRSRRSGDSTVFSFILSAFACVVLFASASV
jgi:hypothetical protein